MRMTLKMRSFMQTQLAMRIANVEKWAAVGNNGMALEFDECTGKTNRKLLSDDSLMLDELNSVYAFYPRAAGYAYHLDHGEDHVWFLDICLTDDYSDPADVPALFDVMPEDMKSRIRKAPSLFQKQYTDLDGMEHIMMAFDKEIEKPHPEYSNGGNGYAWTTRGAVRFDVTVQTDGWVVFVQ